MTAGTLNADQTAALFGVSPDHLYNLARKGECPVAPIRLGRRLVWPRKRVLDLLGLDETELDLPVSTEGAPVTETGAPTQPGEHHLTLVERKPT